MEPSFRSALSRIALRVTGSRFARPVARVVLAGAALGVLAFVGRTAALGAVTAGARGDASGSPAAGVSAAIQTAPVDRGAPPASDDVSRGALAAGSPIPASPTPSRRATAEDPVVLNTATEADLRRLPGVGAKRAEAILVLRARVGRFHALEDLLKVKGFGRATLKRLRPLLRLDPSPPTDAGAARPSGGREGAASK